MKPMEPSTAVRVWKVSLTIIYSQSTFVFMLQQQHSLPFQRDSKI